MKRNKFIFIIFFGLLIFLNSCQSAKDGLTGKKKNNSDEFLVEKKNPLVLPPDYNDLPLPKSERDSVEQMNQDNNSNDIKKLIDNESGESSSQKSAASDNQSLENSILKTLNEN